MVANGGKIDEALSGETAERSAAPANGSETILDRLGGMEAVDAAVEIFYGKVLEDDKLSPFFEGVDVDNLRDMQKTFLAMAFGGEDEYSGRDLASAHAGLVEKGLNDSHFDRAMKCFRQTLEELGVGEDLMIDVLTVAERTRPDVLGLNSGNASPGKGVVENTSQAVVPGKAAVPTNGRTSPRKNSGTIFPLGNRRKQRVLRAQRGSLRSKHCLRRRKLTILLIDRRKRASGQMKSLIGSIKCVTGC